MELRIAAREHNADLIEFYKSFRLDGPVEIKVDRCQDFFEPYRIQSDYHLTYILNEPSKKDFKIEGTASFVIRDALIKGQPVPVAFGRDLRISSNRHAVMNWSRHFLPVLEEVTKAYGCQYVFTVLNMGDVQALNAFVHSRSLKRAMPRYFMFRRLNLVSVHGRWPWASNPLPHVRIERAQPKYYDALQFYIIQKSFSRELATVWNSQSFSAKLERWRKLSLNDFIIAIDKNDNIVGCTVPWSSEGIQEFVPLSYNLRAHNFRQFLKFGRLAGMSRPLTKPVTRLKSEQSLNFNYLCFLHADNEDIFESLLWSAYNQSNKKSFLVYSQVEGELIYRRPLSWITAKLPYAIYLILPPDQEPPDFVGPSNDSPCEMEPFYI